MASLMAMFIQVIAAKLGVAAERGIAALCRERFSKHTVYLLWAAAELAMIATDVAEILGSAIGTKAFNLFIAQCELHQPCMYPHFSVQRLQSCI
jgi:NRAMP (natural resistance-associated macrophage protein)-like metal ion transporter